MYLFNGVKVRKAERCRDVHDCTAIETTLTGGATGPAVALWSIAAAAAAGWGVDAAGTWSRLLLTVMTTDWSMEAAAAGVVIVDGRRSLMKNTSEALWAIEGLPMKTVETNSREGCCGSMKAWGCRSMS